MIYKPTDLSPSAQTFDVMDTPIFFECKVDTSNVQASGFTIEILDSENNVVFSSIPEGKQLNINYITIIDDLREYVHTYFSDYETGYSLLNTGYNGSYLKFPFSVAYDSKANTDNTSVINQIFYIPNPNGIVTGLTEDEIKISSGLYKYNYIWTTGDNPEYIINTSKPLIPVKIYNGKEYKWSITLYQLENKGTTKNPVWTLPENPLMFDMPMTIGTVLGSNNKRIQSAFSEEIYGDYFIQLLKLDNLEYANDYPQNLKGWKYSGTPTQIGDRVLIKSYDMSFGFIYPTEGDDGIDQADMNPLRANAFRIYKNGNSKDNLTAYQQVSYVCNTPLDSITAKIYSSQESYNVGDIVIHNDYTYRCLQSYTPADNINTTPEEGFQTDYWTWYNGATWTWESSLVNAGESYGKLVYYSSQGSANGKYNVSGINMQLQGGERIVLNAQSSEANYNGSTYLGSPYNGIYYPEFSSQYSNTVYSATQNYQKGDIVILNGVIYYCNGIVVGKKPGEGDGWTKYWTITTSVTGTEEDKQDIETDTLKEYNNTKKYIQGDKAYVRTDNTGDDEETKPYVYTTYQCLGVVYGENPPDNLTSGDNINYWSTPERGGYKVVVRWIRTPDADTWGELMTKVVMVTSPQSQFYGKNIQIKDVNENSDAYGVINSTPFMFIEEEPINIYTYDTDINNKDINNIGLILYNEPIIQPSNAEEFNLDEAYNINDVVEVESGYYKCIKQTSGNIQVTNNEHWRKLSKYEGNKNGILYIRYFEGIQKGMMLQKLSSDNKYQYFIIDDVGTNGGMYLKYHEVKEFDTYKSYDLGGSDENPYALVADTTWEIDKTKYQIKTYFRESDENAFYFYSRPEIDIQFKNTNGVNFTTDRTPLVEAYKWEDGRIYGAGDYVYKDTGISEPYTRIYYLCLKNNVKDVDPSNATASAGKWLNTGTDGIRNYEYALYYVSGVKYNVGDYVYLSIDDKITYYKCLKNETTDAPNKTGGTSDWLEVPLDINYKKDTIVKYNGVYYIALTNISQLAEPVKPEKENLGIFWEPYVGVLFREDIGFTYSLYSDLKVYDRNSVVYYEGKYYYTKKDITSIQPPVIYEENKNYNTDDIVWINSDGDIVYYKAIKEINQTESPIIPEQDITGSWELYDNFSDFIWNPYTNVQLKDEEENPIEYHNGWTVVYKGVTYECVTSNDSGIEPEDTDTVDSFINNGSWIKYNKLDGDEIFIDGIRYNKNNTIYTEFNSKEMYLLNRVIYCDGIQYKVTSTVLEYNASTEYEKGDYVSYDVDDVGIYEYYICISDEPIKNQAPVLKDQSNHKELNDNYWATTVINTLPKITEEEYFGKYISWVNTRLYNHGDIVLYNDVFYVYINENSQKMSVYNNATNYEIGDLVRYKEPGAGT